MQSPDKPFINADLLSAAASNHPHLLFRCVTVPISLPFTDIWKPGESSESISSSLGNGPPPTLVV